MKTCKALLAGALSLLLLAGCTPTTGEGGSSASAPEQSKWSDSLIEELYSEEEKFQGAVYSYHVPQLKADTEDAKTINRTIDQAFGDLVRVSLNDMEQGYDPVGESVTWTSYWDDSMVSLLVTSDYGTGQNYYEAYNYDFETGKQVTQDELLQRTGWDPAEYREALRKMAANEFDRSQDSFEAGAKDWMPQLRAKTICDDTLDMAKLFLDEDGTLTAAATIFTPAGGGTCETLLKPEKFENVSKSASCEFVHAELKDNQVWVTFQKTEESDWFLNGRVQYDTPYQVKGLYGNYTDLYMGPVGTDFFPFLFVTDDQGRVTFCNVIHCTELGDHLMGIGPLRLEKPVVSYEDGLVPDGRGDRHHTVFAVDADENRTDLMDYLEPAEKNLVANMKDSSWGTPDSKFGFEYRDGRLTVCDYDHPNGENPNFVGWISYLGMTDRGIEYYFCLGNIDPNYKSPDGTTGNHEWKGILRFANLDLYPDPAVENQIELELISGPDAFGMKAGDTIKLSRSWG